MPRRRARRQAAVRRYLALQRDHDRARAEIRFRLHAEPRRLEAGARRKTYRRRTAGNSMRDLAAGGRCFRRNCGRCVRKLKLKSVPTLNRRRAASLPPPWRIRLVAWQVLCDLAGELVTNSVTRLAAERGATFPSVATAQVADPKP